MLDELNALLAFVVALAGSAALTPVVRRIALRADLVDRPRNRGLSDRPVPLLGGIAILAGVVLAAVLELPDTAVTRAILGGAAVITLVGALDDRFELPAWAKLIGQVVAALIPVLSGVVVTNFTLPFLGHIDLGGAAKPLTLLGLVFLMNVVNFSDGIDGLAAGVCTISSIAFSIIAFDLGQNAAAILAALIAGASLGFLFYNFNPASIFMGDSGAMLLGYLLGCVIVQGTLKTNAVIALVFPLVILAVPFVDTTFVVLKRVKYRRPVYVADRWHLHHRMSNIGFSQRRTVLYLYGWTVIMAGLAVALRFVPYSDHHGHFHTGWTAAVIAFGVLVIAASVYLVYVLEILKFKRLDAMRLRRIGATEAEIDEDVQRRLETGEFEQVRRETEEFDAVRE